MLAGSRGYWTTAEVEIWPLPYFVAGIMTIIRTRCPEPHLNPATSGALGHRVGWLSSESAIVMVPSSVHPSFVARGPGWVGGTSQTLQDAFELVVPSPGAQTSVCLFLGSWSSQPGWRKEVRGSAAWTGRVQMQGSPSSSVTLECGSPNQEAISWPVLIF